MPASQRPGLRKREIVFAVALGTVAAGGAALMLADHQGGPAPAAAMAAPQVFDVEEFQEISTIGPQDLEVTLGETYSVRSEGPPEALGQLEVLVEDGELTIRPKDEFGFGFDWSRLSGATYHVTVPRLERVSLAGSGNVRVDRIESESFSGAIAGSGVLEIAAMRVDEADLSIGGSGNIVAAGTAREARVSIGGSGEVHADRLRSETASVSIGGSGDVALAVDQEAEVSVMGSGNVDIAGPARCSISRMGSGQVRCEGDETAD